MGEGKLMDPNPSTGFWGANFADEFGVREEETLRAAIVENLDVNKMRKKKFTRALWKYHTPSTLSLLLTFLKQKPKQPGL